MPSKILYFQQSFPNLTETFVSAEIEELLARDYDVDVLCLSLNQEQLPLISFGERVRAVSASLRDPLQSLVEEIQQRQVDYLHAPWSTEAWRILRPIAEVLQIPFGCSVHAADIWRRGNRLEPEELRDLGSHPLCVTIAVEGMHHYEYLRWCRVPEDKLIVTPNSVSEKQLPMPREEPPSQLKNVLSIGRPVAKKGFYSGIDAVRFLNLNDFDVGYEILGGGDAASQEGQALVRYCEQFPFVRALGLKPHAEVLQRLREADALLVPSIVAENGDSDGLPTVITEAMLLGVPVVATDVGSISDLIVDGETGFLARASDASSIANKFRALQSMLSDKSEIQKLLDAARKRAARHETVSSVNVLAAHLESKLGRFLAR